MKQYVNPVELTAELLNTLIEKITVHEAVKGEDGSLENRLSFFYADRQKGEKDGKIQSIAPSSPYDFSFISCGIYRSPLLIEIYTACGS